MKALLAVGLILILLGILAFLVPLPQREEHSVKLGDAKIGIQTETSRKLPTPVGAVLLGAGVLVFALAARTRPR